MRGPAPSRVWSWLLRRALPAEHRDDLVSEIALRYAKIASEEGRARADRWYRRQVLSAWRPNVYLAWPRSLALTQDLQHALHRWRRRPGPALACVFVLGLGAGGTAAVQAIAHSLARSSVRVPDVEHVYRLLAVDSTGNAATGFDQATSHRLREASDDFGVQIVTQSTMHIRESTVLERASYVDRAWLSIMQAEPLIGRLPTAPGEVLLSSTYWHRHLNGDVGVLGEPIRLDRLHGVVVGVAPADFLPPGEPSVIVLDGVEPTVVGAPEFYLRAHGAGALDAAHARASAAVNAEGGDAAPRTAQLVPVTESIVGAGEQAALKQATGLLTGMALLLLMAGVANAANLLASDAAQRGREMSVRRAIGASSPRIAVQLAYESAVLGLAAAVAALGVAWLLLATVPAWLPVVPGVHVEFTLHVGPSLLAAGLSLVAALLAAHGPLYGVLRGAACRGTRGGLERLRDWLSAAQVVQAVVLLAVTLAFMRSVHAIREVPQGYTPDGTAVFVPSVPRVLVDSTEVRALHERILDAVSARPEVARAALVAPTPILGWRAGEARLVESQTSVAGFELWVTTGFFEASGAEIVRGAAFDAADREAVVITETLAHALAPEGNVVGRLIDVGGGTTLRVTGVTAEGAWGRTSPVPMMFRAMQAGDRRDAVVIVRSATGHESTAPTLAFLRAFDPRVAVDGLGSLRDLHDRAHLLSRGINSLAAIFAVLALLVSGVGLHATLAHRVAQRSREIGIRLALGASHWMVTRKIALEGLRLTLVALGVGLALAVAAVALLEALIFGVPPLDPVVLGGTTLMLMVVAAISTIVPSIRISAVEPSKTIRDE